MTETTGARRDPSLDTLRTLLIAWIIGGHALLGYSAIGGWGYDEVQEVTFLPKVEFVLAAVLGPSAIFLMGTFFLVAGLFTPASVNRKGVLAFCRERALRLGLPFVASAFVIWPMTMWVAYRSSGRSVSYGFLLTGRDRLIDSGGLWFAEVLLIFSLFYAVWRWLGPAARPDPGPITMRHLILLAIIVFAVTFFIRRWFHARAPEYFDLHVWQWPQLLSLFILGIIGARRGLLERVKEPIGRQCGFIALGTVLTVPLVAVIFGIDDTSGDLTPFLSGWRVESAVLATYEAILVVFGSCWLLRFAQLKLGWSSPFWAHMSRSSFAAFILQGPVLILIAVAIRPLPLPAEIKAPLVMVAGLAGCFWLGWLLVTRTRIGRIV
ncbi:acyltransferase family protein [Nocardioides limicola]|uniref:acyltransferase family protein n=1 Tax=Nocardioides limicola TaxID=2803368 RepID=UPI00193C16D9|nr:acyltransferase [Nocardioides sp. DJM-14]